jgi:hypothetical protein
MNEDISTQSLIIYILNNLDNNYEMEVKLLEQTLQLVRVENKESNIEDIRMDLNLRYERLKHNTNNQTRTMEHAYYMGVRFKGK